MQALIEKQREELKAYFQKEKAELAVKLEKIRVKLSDEKLQQTATQDFMTLCRKAVQNPELNKDKTWVAMFLKASAYADSTEPIIKPCLVCNKVDQSQWSEIGYTYGGLHCAEHAEEFHKICTWTHNCCLINYHPANDYDWRDEAVEPIVNKPKLLLPVKTST